MMSRFVCFQPSSAIIQPMCRQQQPQRSSKPPRKKTPPAKPSAKSQTFVVVMRHGMTDWNLAGRVQGNMDESRLNELGIRQAHHAGGLLARIPFGGTFTSPLNRARHTLDIMTEASENKSLRVADARVLDGLTEIEFPWQGSLHHDIRTGPWSKPYHAYKQNPRLFSFQGFNPVRDIERRAQHVWQMMRTLDSGCHLMISHNQTNKVLLSTALDLPADLYAWNQANCCINIVALEPGMSPTLRMCNSFVPLPGSNIRRSQRRNGTVRLVLHHGGDVSRLVQELQLNATTRLYTIDSDAHHALLDVYPDMIIDHYPVTITPAMQAGDSIMYDHVVGMLKRIRHEHANCAIGLSIGSGRMLSAFVSACFRLGASGMWKFHSDPGGTSIIDISTINHISVTPVRVECFNVPPIESDDNLLRYTMPFEREGEGR